jgi:diaminopimelate epimerase
MRIEVVKGHGTRNDFVLIPDASNDLAEVLTPQVRAWLCDRRAGLGGDGTIRVVPVAEVADAGDQSEARWFMDYRNADGSLAEMCGNGARVFARYLVDQGWESGPSFAIGTRGGPVDVEVRGDGTIAVAMATPVLRDPVTVAVGERSWPATTLTIPNPHAVAFVDDLGDAGDLLTAPAYTPVAALPAGANVEFVVDRGERHVAMRVHERGSGETMSCGTGAAAVAVAAHLRAGGALDGTATWTVDVPGGRLVVELVDGAVTLVGPAVIVGTASIDLSTLGPIPRDA